MDILTPGEHLDGTIAQRRKLRSLLTALRTDPQPAPLAGITFRPLPDVLASGLADQHLFMAGYDLMSRRYQALGITAMLPLARVWVGVTSAAAPGTAGSFGGFHHPGQGYRHLQMAATVTVYGNLVAAVPAPPQAIALDLLRSYAHDCLHYGTFRRYQLGRDGQAARIQYGINFRRLGGRTYSAPDPPGTACTRNLGITMEGATDNEATGIARAIAAGAGIATLKGTPGIARYTFADVTGTLSAAVIEQAGRASHPYLCALGGFGRGVTERYRALLALLGGGGPGDLHHAFAGAMVSGDLSALGAHLDRHNGPGSFTGYFQAPGWDRAALTARRR